jgi:hypothetical protein
MIRELAYLIILFIAGFFILHVFYSFYNSAGKIIAKEVENITNINYVSPISYIINKENFNGYSILYLIQNQQSNVCINKIEVNNVPVNFSYKMINQYTVELNISGNVNAGSNITIEYCNGQYYNYIIT